MRTSIALCTYNGEKFLAEQLKSFAAQTRLPDELIVCDDQSNDKTIEISREFAETAPFAVKIHINEKNLGSTQNFGKAVSLCGGEIIFLSDQDDVWASNKIEKICVEFEKDANVGMIFTNAELVDENLRPLGSNVWETTFPEKLRADFNNSKIFEHLLRDNFVTGATMAFRAEMREKFLPIPSDLSYVIHDAWFALISLMFFKVIFIDENLIKYRQHQAQQIGIRNNNAKTKEPHRQQYAAAVARCKRETDKFKKIIKAVAEINSDEEILKTILDLIEEFTEKSRHYQIRAKLPQNRLRRINSIFRETVRGNYNRFSSGFSSAIKDLLIRLE